MQFERRGPPHPGPLPKEREPSLTDPRNSLDGDFAFDCEMFSLSLRERAGVRGNGVSNCIVTAKAGTPSMRKFGVPALAGSYHQFLIRADNHQLPTSIFHLLSLSCGPFVYGLEAV